MIQNQSMVAHISYLYFSCCGPLIQGVIAGFLFYNHSDLSETGR